jgi:hypothetical protein
MAYISQDRKKIIAKNVKAVCKSYGFGGRDVTVAVDNHSTLVVNLWNGPLDFIGDINAYNRAIAQRRGEQVRSTTGNYQVNPYWCEEHAVDPVIKRFFGDLLAAIKSTGYYNNSNSQIDYFDHDFYIDINCGKWDKPYNYSNEMKEAA